MIYDFESIIDRKNTNSLKWEFVSHAIEGAHPDALPLWLADMDFACAQPILDALHRRIDRKIFGYSDHHTDKYYDAVCGWFKRRFDWAIPPENIVVSPGVVPALCFLVRALTEEGQGIIIQQPVYYPFSEAIINNNRRVVNNSLINEDGHYTIDFEDLEQKAQDPENRLMIFCSPHNPVGRAWTPAELTIVADICRENNVILISDEIHCDIVRKGVKHTPIAKLTSNDQIIVCTSASKSFNLAGMHHANIIIKSQDLRNRWYEEVHRRTLLIGPNTLGIVATQAAYTQGEEWLTQVNGYIDANLDYVAQYLKKNLPSVRYEVPEGTYLAWLDMRPLGYSHIELKALMLERANVALDEGPMFGEEGQGFMRINAACPRPILNECLKRMKLALQ